MTSTPFTDVPVANLPVAQSRIAADLATIGVLVRRDVMRFFRERSRIAGALVQPLLFWVVLGGGFAPTFRLAGAEHVGYQEYFFPGVTLMVVLFAAMFGTMSVIEDRHQGFLQAVLSGPGSRFALVFGKCLAVTVLALGQALCLLALAPIAGFPLARIAWLPVVTILALTSMALSGIGFAVAWKLDSIPGYHVVMNLLLLPAWVLSGAMFPGGNHGGMHTAMVLDPLSYAADGVRRAMYGGVLPVAMGTGAGTLAEWSVVVAFAALGVGLAVGSCRTGR